MPETKHEQWSASTHDEYGFQQPCDTREQAIAELIQSENVEAGQTIYVGKLEHPKIELDWRELDYTFERIVENHGDTWAEIVCERVGEAMKPDRIKELAEEIRPIVAAWADRHGIGKNCWTVDASPYVVTEQDMAAVYED